jgi:ketosteroid isomerase-like protein
MADLEELVDSFAAALEGRGSAAFIASIEPGAILWHNNDRLEVDAITHMGNIEMLSKVVRDAAFQTVRCAPIKNGFVLQFAFRGTLVSNGRNFEMQNCIVATTADGMISRIDEYVDPTTGAQLAS